MIGVICLALAQDWSGFREGSSITVRTTTTTGSTKKVKTEVFTIVKSAETVTVQVETDEDGTKTKREDTYRPGVDSVTYGGENKGTKDVTIDGVKLKCAILEETIEGLAGKTVTRRWICKDAPTLGGLVKQEMSGTASNSSIGSTFQLLRLKETVKVKGQSFSCWTVETSGADEVMKTKSKAWYSKGMPGTLVKSESTMDTGSDTPTKVTVEVIAIDLKK